MSQRPGAAQGAQQQWEGEFFCFFSRARLRVSPRRAGWARPNRCYALGWGRAGIEPRVSGASARPGPNLSRTGPLIFSKDTGLVPYICHRQRRSAAPSTANRPRRRIPGRGRCSRGPDPRPPPHALLVRARAHALNHSSCFVRLLRRLVSTAWHRFCFLALQPAHCGTDFE